MKVIQISPRGFCPGVVKAIKIVNDCLSDPSLPRPIQILGMIVHNQFIVDEFTKKGVITIEEVGKTRLQMIDKINEGTVIITAHGISDDVLIRLKEKRLTVVDATCHDVLRTKDLIMKHLALQHQIIYIGKKLHPETEGVLGLSSKIYLVETEADIEHLPLNLENVFVTNQTTFSMKDIIGLLSAISKKYKNVLVSDEICDSTRLRQEAIIEQNKDVDLCFIVGDVRSNNTANLAKLSWEVTHTRTIRISSVDDIDEHMLEGVRVVSVSSGASTPSHITKAVINYLQTK